MGARSGACVVGYCTGGNDAASVTLLTAILTLPTTGLNGVAPPRVGDWLLVLAAINANVTISGPTDTVGINGPNNSSNNNVGQLFRYQLKAADITAGTFQIDFSSTGRGTAVGVVLRDVDMLNIAIGTTILSNDAPAVTAVHSDENLTFALVQDRTASAAGVFVAPTGYTIGQSAVRSSVSASVHTAIASRNAGTTPDEVVNPSTWSQTGSTTFWTYTVSVPPLWPANSWAAGVGT